jgi:hypothetical protein
MEILFGGMRAARIGRTISSRVLLYPSFSLEQLTILMAGMLSHTDYKPHVVGDLTKIKE